MKPPPSTPTPRRFILSKRTPILQTPGPDLSQQFQSTPRFGYSAQRRTRDGIDDVEDEETDGTEPAAGEPLEDSLHRSDAIDAESEVSYLGDAIEESVDSHGTRSSEVSPSKAHEQDVQLSSDEACDVPSKARDKLHPSPTQERERKRRRVSRSPGDEDERCCEDEGDGQIGNEEQGTGTPRRPQPVFQPAPRFKLPDPEEDRDILPEAFSPHRHGKGARSRRYLPGGMASQVQGWLSEVKGWEESVRPDADTSFRILISQIRTGSQMYLVRGTTTPEVETKNYMLAGEGKLTGLQGRAAIHEGSVVLVEWPAWDVTLDGITWTVACNWSVGE